MFSRQPGATPSWALACRKAFKFVSFINSIPRSTGSPPERGAAEGGCRVKKSVLYLSQTQFSPTVEEQRERFAAPGDIVHYASEVSFASVLGGPKHNAIVEAGDRLKLYDLNSFAFPQATLVRMLTKLLRAGIVVEICSAGLVIQPEDADPYMRLLMLLDAQQRALHAVRTHAPEVKAGRKHAIKPELWPEISALIAGKVPSQEIADRYGVGRTTLFNYVKRMKAQQSSAEERFDANAELGGKN